MKCVVLRTLTWKNLSEPSSSSHAYGLLVYEIKRISRSITKKSKVMIELETSRIKVLQKSKPKISKLVVLMKPDTTIQKSKSQVNLVPTTSGSKLLKCSEANVNSYPWQNFYKNKIWSKVRQYSKVRENLEKRPRVKNTKRPIRL